MTCNYARVIKPGTASLHTGNTMKPGFLGHKLAKQVETAEERSLVTGTAPPRPQHEQPDRTATSQGQQQLESWKQCLQLLRSDVDEKKFVGLLLVTKLLPHGDDHAVQQVLDAVGLKFIHRLLLPLQQKPHHQQQRPLDEAKLQQQHLSIVLGLSILSVACRLPQISSSEDILQLLPLLLKVAAAGGVAAAMPQPYAAETMATTRATSSQWADPVSEAAAAADALDCIVACVSAGTDQQAVAVESNVFTHTVNALHVALVSLGRIHSGSSSTLPGTDEDSGASLVALSRLQGIMLTIRLLSVLLAQHSSVLVQQNPDAAAAAVMLLATVLEGLPQTATSSSGVRSAGSNRDVDSAVLQLEALHALLLLLPLPEGSLAAGLPTHVAATSAEEQKGQQSPGTEQQLSKDTAALVGDWPAAVRQGLCQLLKSKVGVVQRYSALHLAAMILDLLGTNWLLPSHEQVQQQTCSNAASSAAPEHFLLVLMELLAIETPLLLSDAMNPAAVVPRADLSMPARTAAAAAAGGEAHIQPQRGAESKQPSAAVDMDVDAGDDGDSSQQLGRQQQEQQQALSVQQVLHAVQQQEAHAKSSSSNQQPSSSSVPTEGPPGFKVMTPDQKHTKSLQQKLAELELPADKAPGPEHQIAGDRAQQCLPACFQLLEGCLEVLVQQAGLLEQLADITAVSSPDADAIGSVLPGLSWEQLSQLMQRMQQIMEVLLEFLQFATSHTGAATVNPLLTVGAVRVLGRFLADAPDVHQDLVRKLLPKLLEVQVTGEPLVSGVSFLLPALLSWTHSSCTSQLQWVDVLLRDDGQCMSALANFIVKLTTAASSASSLDPDTLAGAEARLGTACLVLHQLLSILPAATALQQTKAQARQPQQDINQRSSVVLTHLSDRGLQALIPVLHCLSCWGHERMQQQQQKQKLMQLSDGAQTAAAEFLQSLQHVKLDAGVLLSAAVVVGHLLMLIDAAGAANASAATPEQAEAAGQLLSWGCEAGWSYRVLSLWQGSQQVHEYTPNNIIALREKATSLLDDVEMEELWEVSLSTAAELVLTKSAVQLVGPIRSAHWSRHASQVESEAAASVGLQLLLQALRSM